MSLLLVARSRIGQELPPFRVERGRISIGRAAECDWTLPDPAQQISARHCEIAWVGDGYAVADASTNGTLLNGERLTAARRLADGDALGIGDYRIAVAIPGAIEQAAKPGGTAVARPLARALAGLNATRAKQRREVGVTSVDPLAGNPLAADDPIAALSALPPAEATRAIEAAAAAIDRHNAAALMAMQQVLRELDAKAAAGFAERFATLFRDAYASLADRP